MSRELRHFLRKPTKSLVRFARSTGFLDTLEGRVRFHAGDAIVTGVRGEEWPVQRARFEQTYEPVDAGFALGSDGEYRRKVSSVLVFQTTSSMSLSLSDRRGSLSARVGDWIVTDADGCQWVVADGIFQETYDAGDGP